MKLLEENGRQGQAQDLSQILWYMDGMNRQYEAVLRELQEVRKQLNQVQKPSTKYVMQNTAAKLERRVHQIKDTLDSLWEKIAGCAATAVENFKEMGVSALDRAVAAMSVKKGLEHLQEGLQSSMSGIKDTIGKAEEMGVELRRAGRHIKNVGRIAANQETSYAPVIEEGRFQSAVLAPMRATQKLLSSMNNATLAAIGSVEHLEQTAEDAREARAERQAEKKPSIRQALAEKRTEAAARSAPAPEKEHKVPEAGL